MDIRIGNLGEDDDKRQVTVKQDGLVLWLSAGLEVDTAPTYAPLTRTDALALSEVLKAMAGSLADQGRP